jgi:hypothetical protein
LDGPKVKDTVIHKVAFPLMFRGARGGKREKGEKGRKGDPGNLAGEGSWTID